MSRLRSELTPDEVRSQAEASNESLPEAFTVDRDAADGTASATSHSAGDEPYTEEAGDSDSRLPADPPTGSAETGS